MRQRSNILYLLIIFSLLNTFDVFAQTDVPEWRKESELGQPLFNISTHRRLGLDPASVRVDIIVEVMSDMLMFVRKNDEFIASIDLNLSIIQSDEGRIINQVKHLSKRVSKYELTNSRQDYIKAVFSVILRPFPHIVKVTLEDKESRRRETVEKKINLGMNQDAARLDISDLMLARSNEVDPESGVLLHPTVSGVVPDPSSELYCYFDLLRKDPNKTCKIKLNVKDKSGKIQAADSLEVTEGERLSSCFMTIPCKDLSFNRYEILLNAYTSNDTVIRKTEFSVNFHGLPWVIRDLDQAIMQLRYVADSEEIARLTHELPFNKEETFLNFWNDNFPCSGEPVNGKMIEYYNRVNYANIHFASNREGWLSDRGRVLIINGKPSEVEKSYSEDNSVEYEVWYYNHLNQRFIFRDDYGFGDFRLSSPIW